MRKYRSNASSMTRVEYGIELCVGLTHFSETASFAVDLKNTNDALSAQYQTRTALRIPVLHARANERLAHHTLDQTIRAASRAAEVIDGGKRGRIFEVAFPKGLKPVVAPQGKSQVKAAEELIDRIEKSLVPSIEPYRAEWLPKLNQALAAYTSAIATHTAAKKTQNQAFQQEVALREAHFDAVDKVIGLVRATFPRDREKQDVIFPEIEAEGAEDQAEERAPS